MAEGATAMEQEALVTTALDGRVMGWSRGAQALLGFKEREILGRRLSELVHEKHRAVDAQNQADVAAGATVRDTLVKYVRGDGGVVPCLQTMLPLRDAVGRVNGAVRLVCDLSVAQEAERAVRRLAAQLHELAKPAGGAAGAGELARTLADERRRTRRQFLEIVRGEARRLERRLDELATAADDAAEAGERDLQVAG